MIFFSAANKICNFIVYSKSNWRKISLVVYKWYISFLGLRRIINWIMMQRVIMKTDQAKQIIASNFMATESYRTNYKSMKLCTSFDKSILIRNTLHLNKLKIKRWSKTETRSSEKSAWEEQKIGKTRSVKFSLFQREAINKQIIEKLLWFNCFNNLKSDTGYIKDVNEHTRLVLLRK